MIQLPAILNPISRRKDKSCLLKFDTRELSPEEVLTLMSLEGGEGWLAFAPNQEQLEIPEGEAEVDGKTPSQRLKGVLYVLYKQETQEGKYVGIFDSFYKERMEKLIEFIKQKIT